jgi:hypothetical protein
MRRRPGRRIPGKKSMLKAIKNIPVLRRWYYTRDSPIKLVRLKYDYRPAIKKNRATLGLVPHWLDEDVYRSSIFQYGLPPHIRAFIDQPISESPTYSDLIVSLASKFPSLSYLELGPSVGKNFFQVAKAAVGAELVAVDIEEINPVLAQRLNMKSESSWPTMEGSKRTAFSSQKVFELDGNRVEYVAGDLFDVQTWDRLNGRKFNMIFSDAFHSSDALLMEWENISKRGLISPGPLAMVWDDLNSQDMRSAFYKIAAELFMKRPNALVSLELFQGWVGHHESSHLIGVVRDGL